jgi:hypothetical protein
MPFAPKNQRGQIFVGFLIAMLIVMGLLATVTRYIQVSRQNAERRVYQEQALMVARMGFEEGLSYFRRQTAGVYLEPSDAAPDQSWGVWKMHPDSAFLPQAADTDHYSSLSIPASTADGAISPAAKVTARAIIRTFPLLTTASNTSTSELYKSPLWGRFVLRRQNTRNWSPGGNTMAVFTDPEAAHDLSQFRGTARPGSGNVWSLYSKGYVFTNPASVTYSAWFATPSLHEKNDLLNPPLASYLGKPFLKAKASVYGELYRLSFNDQNSALWVRYGASVTAKDYAVITGGATAYAVTRSDNTSVTLASLTTTTVGDPIVAGNPSANNSATIAPSVGNAFPGMDEATLKKMADKVQGAEAFTHFDNPSLSDITSAVTFVWVTTSAGSSPVANTAYFPSGLDQPVLTGNGMVFIKGNLDIAKGNYSGWRGIVFVDGNVTMRGPATITGTLIATGKVTLGNALDNSQTKVEYNAAALNSVKDYLQRFEVLKSSIVTTVY